jgi:hypothetical protein
MAGTINGITTSNIRLDIPVSDDPKRGVQNAEEVASILRQLADLFEAGHKPNLPTEVTEGDWQYLHSVEGVGVDYL